MIRVYNDTEITTNKQGALVIDGNGLKTLHPLFAEITKVKDGDYYIEIEDLIENFEYYQKGMILKVNTPSTWGEYDFQCFRCDNPRVENNRVYCKAWHLYYDTKNYIIDKSHTVYNKTCDEAIKYFKNYVDYSINNPFDDTLSSNITTIPKDPLNNNDGITIEVEDMSLYGVIEYLRDVYGGTLVRDNFKVAINQSIGEDRGVVLAYNKNITDMTAEENWDDVCTKILPYTMVGDTKITLNANGETDPFVRWEDVSDKENPYGIPYSKIVEFKNESGSEDSNTVRNWLKDQAKAYLIANSVPKFNYKVSAEIDNISDVGDTIHIKHPKILIDGMYLNSTVMSIKYDAIRGKYTEIEFGNFRRAIKNIFTETSALKGEIAKTVEAIKGASSVESLLTNNKVIYRGEDILIVDKLPAEEATNCYRISDTGISFSNTGINGTFTKVYGVDGTIDLGGANNVGKLNLYNESGIRSISMDKDGLILYVSGGACLQIGNVLSSGHKLRIRQKAQNSTTWDSWRFIQEEGVVLYDNTATTGSTSVNLNTYINSNDDFKYIEIFYSLFTAGYDGNKNDFYHSVRVYSPLGKRISLLASTIDASGNIKMGVGVVKFASNSSTKVTTLAFETGTNSGIANKTFNSSNMATASGTQEIFIRRVVGYKV